MNKRQKKKFAQKLGHKKFVSFRIQKYLDETKNNIFPSFYHELLFGIHLRLFSETEEERAAKDRVLKLLHIEKESERNA